jgi:hypothetical protein
MYVEESMFEWRPSKAGNSRKVMHIEVLGLGLIVTFNNGSSMV